MICVKIVVPNKSMELSSVLAHSVCNNLLMTKDKILLKKMLEKKKFCVKNVTLREILVAKIIYVMVVVLFKLSKKVVLFMKVLYI